jgi:hypothetical protein
MAIVPVSTSTAKRAAENRSMANPPQAILDKKHAANGCGLIDMPMGLGRSLDAVKSTALGFKPRASKPGQCRPRGWIAI